MTYGSLIKQSREDLRLTQEQLAEQLDVSRQAVSKWEADLSRPTREKLGRLSEILNIPPDAWAQADAEIRAAAQPPDTSLPWKLATAFLATACLVLAGCLTISLWPKLEAAPAAPPSQEVLPPEEEPAPLTGSALPGAFPLTVRRDYDFGDLPFGEYGDFWIPFLNDWEKVMEEEIWCGWFPDGTRLSLIPVTASWDETGQHSNVFLLYAPPAEATGGTLEYHILLHVGEDYTGDDHGSPEGEPFTNLLGYDGFKITISAHQNLYRSAYYITQRSDSTPCVITRTDATAYEFDVDEDGLSEIISSIDTLPGWEITDTVEGQEGAFIYTLDYTKTPPEWGQYLLGFDAEYGGFVVVDGNLNSVVNRCVLRNGELVRVPATDYSAADYPDAAGTKVTFVTDVEILSDGLDPDELLPYTSAVRITHRQQAYLALQELYNLTGLKVEECYCTACEHGVLFSLLPDGFNQRSFFCFDFDARYGSLDHIPTLYIKWKELDNDWSPLSLADAVRPEPGAEGAEETMLWYYNRMKVFSTGKAESSNRGDPSYANLGELWLENGDLYNYFMEDTEYGPVLTSITGPYPDGIVNH